MHAYMYICMYICMHAYMYICMHACIYVCMHACTHVCMYVCMHACIYVCKYVGMYICMYVCVCGCVYIYIYTVYIFHRVPGSRYYQHMHHLQHTYKTLRIPYSDSRHAAVHRAIMYVKMELSLANNFRYFCLCPCYCPKSLTTTVYKSKKLIYVDYGMNIYTCTFRSLPYDRSIASSKASSPQTDI
jgi:hypothetical protein